MRVTSYHLYTRSAVEIDVVIWIVAAIDFQALVVYGFCAVANACRVLGVTEPRELDPVPGAGPRGWLHSIRDRQVNAEGDTTAGGFFCDGVRVQHHGGGQATDHVRGVVHRDTRASCLLVDGVGVHHIVEGADPLDAQGATTVGTLSLVAWLHTHTHTHIL